MRNLYLILLLSTLVASANSLHAQSGRSADLIKKRYNQGARAARTWAPHQHPAAYPNLLRPRPAVAAAQAEVPRKMVQYFGTSTGWFPYRIIHRSFDGAGRFISESEFNMNSQDTTRHMEQRYNGDGRLEQVDDYSYNFSGRRLQSSERLTYDALGFMESDLWISRTPDGSGLDTVLYQQYQSQYDVRNRITTRNIYRLEISYRLDTLAPSGYARVRTEEPLKDSLFYLNPQSSRLSYLTMYAIVGFNETPLARYYLQWLDTTRELSGLRRIDQSVQNRWVPLVQGNTVPLGADRYSTFIEFFDSTGTQVVETNRIEDRFDFRLGTVQQGVDFRELEPLVYSRSIRQIPGEPATLSIYEDSIGLDPQGRLLARSTFQGYSDTDTSLGQATDPENKFVITEIGPTGIRPSSAPQTLAIAPGPTTRTILLPAIPPGNWHATLVDMQGGQTSLGRPDKTGILKMPNLATGVYSLHLMDKTGRHLHGRFVWQR